MGLMGRSWISGHRGPAIVLPYLYHQLVREKMCRAYSLAGIKILTGQLRRAANLW